MELLEIYRKYLENEIIIVIILQFLLRVTFKLKILLHNNNGKLCNCDMNM